jgi:hypothetical protein
MRKIFLLLCLLYLCGCGTKIVSVTGEVIYDGKPAPDIAILWEPQSNAKQIPESGIAVTDSRGHFTVSSTGQKKRNGIEPGKYTVFMGWKNPNSIELPEGATSALVTAPYKFPEKISNGNVIVTINESGTNRVVFRVTPDEITWE